MVDLVNKSWNFVSIIGGNNVLKRTYLSRIYMHESSILLLTREFWILRSLYLEPFYPLDLPCNGVSIL